MALQYDKNPRRTGSSSARNGRTTGLILTPDEKARQAFARLEEEVAQLLRRVAELEHTVEPLLALSDRVTAVEQRLEEKR